MARGWESKGVEAQQAEHESRERATGPRSPEEAERLARRRILELSRVRANADLARAKSPAHREMLEAAIKALNDQLKAL